MCYESVKIIPFKVKFKLTIFEIKMVLKLNFGINQFNIKVHVFKIIHLSHPFVLFDDTIWDLTFQPPHTPEYNVLYE